MNKTLHEIIKIYSTKSHIDFSSYLLNLSKDTLISIFSDLLTLYINDKNSSTIREFLTVELAGYKHNTKKIGFNGFKQISIDKAINCEAKPKNFSIQDFLDYKAGIRKTKPSKLNGGGNFTDYTWARFNKDKKENLNMLISGFVDGQLVYLLEFCFNEQSFTNNLKKQLEHKFPKGDKKGYYLRSASFDFKNYKSAKTLKPIFIIDKSKLLSYSEYINKDLYNYLLKSKE